MNALQVDSEPVGDAAEVASEAFRRLLDRIHTVIVGQDDLSHKMLIGLLANGHLLIEGVPGLAKTMAVSCLAGGIEAGFQRIQFTPDLLPADLIGTLVYRPGQGDFVVKKGPIFSNIILADEINRAPAKVQSALLEAMQERQILDRLSETNPVIQAELVMEAAEIAVARQVVDRINVDDRVRN